MSSDEYQVLSAPEETDKQSHPFPTPASSAFHVTTVMQEEEDVVDRDTDSRQENDINQAIQEYEVEPPPSETPGPSEAPEELVKEVYRDSSDEPLLSSYITEKPIEMPQIKPPCNVKKSALLALMTGVSFAFLTSLLYFGNRQESVVTKPSPIYPQPHPTYFQPIRSTLPRKEMERTSLIIVAKQGMDFVWESKEVFQVRCLLDNWLQWLYRCWNHCFNNNVTATEQESESDEDILIVEPLFV